MAKTFRLFASEGTFEQAFPEVEQALIESYETGDDVTARRGDPEPNSYSRPLRVDEPRRRCSNKRCQQGGYDIERELRYMVTTKQVTLETVLDCKGHEGSPKGRRKGSSCMNALRLRLKVKYKPESTKQQ